MANLYLNSHTTATTTDTINFNYSSCSSANHYWSAKPEILTFKGSNNKSAVLYLVTACYIYYFSATKTITYGKSLGVYLYSKTNITSDDRISYKINSSDTASSFPVVDVPLVTGDPAVSPLKLRTLSSDNLNVTTEKTISLGGSQVYFYTSNTTTELVGSNKATINIPSCIKTITISFSSQGYNESHASDVQTVYWSDNGTPPTSYVDGRALSKNSVTGLSKTATFDWKISGVQNSTSIITGLTESYSCYWDPAVPGAFTQDTTVYACNTSSINPSKNYPLPSVIQSNPGYTFAGWKNSNGGNEGISGYTANQYNSDQTFTAVWTPNNITFRFIAKYKKEDGTEITLNSEDKDVAYNSDYTYTWPKVKGYKSKGTTKVNGSDATTIIISYYEIITNSVVLKPSPGNWTGGSQGTGSDPYTYNYTILDGEEVTESGVTKHRINIRQQFQPVLNNSTFVNWINDSTGAYQSSFYAEDQFSATTDTPATMNLTAYYQKLGKFIYTQNQWFPIINTWCYDGTTWQAQRTDAQEGEIRVTQDKVWVYDGTQWVPEYGREDT